MSFELYPSVALYVGKHLCPRQAWEQCERGDWLLHWADRAGIPRGALVLGACACARLALRRIPAGEMRPLWAIEAAEGWARQQLGTADLDAPIVTLDDGRRVREAAWLYRNEAWQLDATTYAAADAVVDAADTVESTGIYDTAAEAAADVVDAEAAAYDSTYDHATTYDAEAVRKTTFLLTAKEVRRVIGWPVMAHALETHDVPLREPWLATVAHTCGTEKVRFSTHDTLGAGLVHTITQVSREMARAGRWDTNALIPLWLAAIEEQEPVFEELEDA